MFNHIDLRSGLAKHSLETTGLKESDVLFRQNILFSLTLRVDV
jgi:hypothetical protein